MIVIHKSQKATYFGNCFWNQPFLNGGYLLLLCLYHLKKLCPKYAICDLKKLHLLGLSLNPAADNFSNILLNLSMCSSDVFEKL